MARALRRREGPLHGGLRREEPVGAALDEDLDGLRRALTHPLDELDQAIGLAEDLVAVGIGVTTTDRLDAAIELIRSVRASHPGLAVLLGGQAVRNPEIAHLAGASMWSAGPDMIDTLNRLRRPRPTATAPPEAEPAAT